MSEKQEIMNYFCTIVLTPNLEERRKALEQVPEQYRAEVQKRVSEWFEIRAQRRVASENARLAREAREAREAEEKRRKSRYGR